MRRLRHLLLILGLAVASVAASPAPPASAQLSAAEEEQLGREQHPKVLAEFGGAYEDPELQAYIEKVGERLVAATPMAGETFTFTIVNSDIVNAFALPGGYVYVSRGLLALAESEAELAGVLGHEIGHVVAHHPARRMQRQQYGSVGAAIARGLGGIVGGLLGGETGAQIGGQLGSLGGQLGSTYFVQGYSREQEFEADQLGVNFLERTGYEPRAMATFLQALQSNDAYQARTEGRRQGGIPSWLRSHPRTPERVERAAAAAAQETPQSREVDRDAFLAAIDGLVFGDDPSQGIVRGTRFEHAELGFAFEAPDGFQLKNRPDAVIGQDRHGRFMQFDIAASRSGDPERYLAQEWSEDAEVSKLDTLSVGGAEAAVGFAQVQVNNRPAAAMLAAIAGDDNKMYRFVFGSGSGLDRSDVAVFEDSVRSFRRIDRSAASEIRPLRVDVVEVAAGDTRESLQRRMAIEESPAQLFDLLNGFTRGRGPLEAGEQVKLVVRQ